MSSGQAGGLGIILAKRKLSALSPDAPRDPTSEKRSELYKQRNKLTRAADDASFEQAAIEFDGLLDAISEGVGKAHSISQERWALRRRASHRTPAQVARARTARRR